MAAHPIFELSDTIVEELAALAPETATVFGVGGYDHLWADASPQGTMAALEALTDMADRIEALEPATDRWDRLALAVAQAYVQAAIDGIVSGDHYFDLNSIASPLQSYRDTFDSMPKATVADWRNIITRLETLDDAISGYADTLETGAGMEKLVPVRQVNAAIEQSRIHASDRSALLTLLDDFEDAELDNPRLGDELDRAIEAGRAAFGGFARFLETAYLPAAPESDAVGRERYLRAAERFLGTVIDPDATYDWAWGEIADLRARMASVAEQIEPGGTIASVLETLKTDPERAAADGDELTRVVQERLDAAVDALDGTHFEVPDAIRDVDVRIAPPGGPLGAYYVGPSEDFTRRGTVFWSIEEGPISLYDEITTAYHEGFPGHHLQVGIQVANSDRLSRLHRMLVWLPGIGEGWALYAERLMDELGFLDTPDYEFGYLAAQMLRACRVVIDIGLHLELDIPTDQPFRPGEPWTFDAAVDMLEEYATLDHAVAVSEAIRYTGWPGQAIAYKVGEKAILDLRAELKERDAFDRTQFHADLLDVGPVGIDLARQMLLT